MNEGQGGECSLSIKKLLKFCYPTSLAAKKTNNFTASAFVPPNYIIVGTRCGNLVRFEIPEKITEHIEYPISEVAAHEGYISDINWNDHLKLLFTTSADRQVKIWQFNSRNAPTSPIQTIEMMEETPLSLRTSLNFLFVVMNCGIVIYQQLVKRDTKKEKSAFRHIYTLENKKRIRCMVFTPNPKVENSGNLYVGLTEGIITHQNAQLASERCSFTIANPPKRVSERTIFNIQFFSKCEVIMIFTYDNHVRVFNPRNYRVVTTIKNEKAVNYINACYDEDNIFLLCDDAGVLYVWEINETSRLMLSVKLSHNNLGVFNAGQNFYCLHKDFIDYIAINKGTVKRSYKVHSAQIFYVTLSEDETQTLAVTCGSDRYVRFWNTTDFSLRTEYKIPTQLSVLSCYVSFKERQSDKMQWILTGHDEGKIIYSNITDGKTAELNSRHRNSISAMTVIENELKAMLFACDYDGYTSMWSIDAIFENISFAAVAMIRMFKAHDCEILAVAGVWNSDEMIVATGGNDRTIKLWSEFDDNVEPKCLQGHTDSVTALELDGYLLFSGGEDMTIRIWDTYNRVQLAIIQRIHTFGIRSICRIAEENTFASSDAGGKVIIYDFVRKRVIWEMQHTTDCRCICISKQQNRLYAVIRNELIPHELPVRLSAGLANLMSRSSFISVRSSKSISMLL